MKIFGIGLSKTGTSSLNSALEKLNFRVIHNPWQNSIVNQFQKGDFSLHLLNKYDAITEFIVPFFKDFDRFYPGSKFILTTREVEIWLQSISNWYKIKGDIAREFRKATFGCYRFNRNHFRDVYLTHELVVKEHFKNRPNDLLIYNICGGAGWQHLCNFLNKPIPNCKFPWNNRKRFKSYL